MPRGMPRPHADPEGQSAPEYRIGRSCRTGFVVGSACLPTRPSGGQHRLLHLMLGDPGEFAEIAERDPRLRLTRLRCDRGNALRQCGRATASLPSGLSAESPARGSTLALRANIQSGRVPVHPAVSAFPERVVGSACTSSCSRLARRSLALRPAHPRGHQFVTRFPKASAISLPP
jgi:hypothetical protein